MTPPPPKSLLWMCLCGLPVEEIARELGVSDGRARSIVERPELVTVCCQWGARIRTALRREIADDVFDAIDELHQLAGLPDSWINDEIRSTAVALAIEDDPEARFANPRPFSVNTVATHLYGTGRRTEGPSCARQYARDLIRSNPEARQKLIMLGASNSLN